MFRRGDIVKVNLNPSKGHEQGNYRPVLVMNSVPLPGNISTVLPITTKQKTYPLEVELDSRTRTTGVILCFQIRTLDLLQRDAQYIEKAPDDIVATCSEYITRMVSSVDY